MNKYIAELIGTFFLVLTIGCTVIGGGGGVIPPLAIGSALMVMIFAGGHISGGHFNPAVTFGAWLRGCFATKDVIPYWVFQVVGAILAALAVKVLRAEAIATVEAKKLDPANALLAEFLFTFALVYVVLNVATAKGTTGNSFYGLAIGFTVLTGAFAVGDISGGAVQSGGGHRSDRHGAAVGRQLVDLPGLRVARRSRRGRRFQAAQPGRYLARRTAAGAKPSGFV